MNDTVSLVLALLAGVLLGAVFFGGLWWTVQKGVSSKQPALWFFGSLLLRTSVCLGWLLLFRARPLGKAAGLLLGFVIARLVVTGLTRAAGKPTCLAQEAGHAP